MKKITAFLAATVIALTAFAQDYAHTVNTVMGAYGSGFGASYLVTGATAPFGMVQMTQSAYDKTIGFVANQLNGCGCPHQGHFPVMPLCGGLSSSPENMTNGKILMRRESGHAGYYECTLNNDVRAELTATDRTGMARFSFPEGNDKNTVLVGSGICLHPTKVAAGVITSPHSCEGYAQGSDFCGVPTPYKVYFVAEFDVDAEEYGSWTESGLHPDEPFAEGSKSGLYFTFDAEKHPCIRYKIALSYVSVENARANMKAENTGWNFDAVRKSCEDKWNSILSKVEVQGTDPVRRMQFYTHLYHAFMTPVLYSDVNGEYMGSDFKVHRTIDKEYACFSNWDTYRSQIQLLSMLVPEVASNIVTSHQHFAEQGGGSFPRWTMLNIETGVMQGDPSCLIVSNAWAFGARGYDPHKLLAIMERGCRPGQKCQNFETRPFAEDYNNGRTKPSLQLEYNNADFAAGRFAYYAAGDFFSAIKFINRSQNWKNLFNPENKWLQGKNPDGSWKEFNYGWDDYVEASYQAYFWMVPFNIQGLVDLIGPELAESRLDDHFHRLDANIFQDWFAICNEPSFQIPWTYNWLGKPWKTARTVNRILTEQFSDAPDGIPGNDDLGSMASWYVFACTGLYPFIPGVGGFALNTPIFEKITYHLPGGDLNINGGSETKIYTNSLKVNGKPYDSTWIPWEDICNGATLDYTTSNKAGSKWGTTILPPSYTSYVK